MTTNTMGLNANRRLTAAAGGVLLTAALASGCARAQARVAPELPPLDMPAPPPRLVEATELPVPAAATLPEEPTRSTPPAPARPRPPAPRVETTKPEPPPPAEAPRVVEEAVKPPPALQTTGTSGETERTIRGLLARATSDLGQIDYQLLNARARTQYDTSKGFIRQAEEALRAKNLVFALNLADKAATLAAQLRNR